MSVAARERWLPASKSNSAPAIDGAGFDPAVDGFGFDNYSTPPVPPKPAEFVSEGDVLRYLTAYWDTALRAQLTLPLNGGPEPRIRGIAEQLCANADRLFGTKGYCYGMAATAQWYFEEPAVVPVDRDSTSEIVHVDDPLEDGSATPVRDDIELFHRAQFLNADSWLRRWPLLRPERIDYRSQERELRATIDEFGSAGVTISGDNVLKGHYVLLYDYEATDTGVTFTAYDPNDDADEHAAEESRTIGIDTTSYEPLMGSYDEEYDRFLFNPEDRAIRARARSKARRTR
ncbi:hypothetical protein [Natronococcus wangiae]|uniref:hypothetical protein n=1 Tax=Natronococcus wangiae TaxID=3068275 RepID=UPI00273EA888|nr:hypothetical protein [Natronococcus sp. AD5]